MNSAKTQVLVNGIPGKEIVCRRGLRQGDSLSPLLFVLVADGLNRMIEITKEVGLVFDLPSSLASMFINLKYADDTLNLAKMTLGRLFLLNVSCIISSLVRANDQFPQGLDNSLGKDELLHY